eukprot:13331396-Ditylum_brightwellii.AAC.1
MEVHVFQFLPLEIQEEEDKDDDFWKETNLDETSDTLISNLVSTFAEKTTKSLINWVHIFE